MRTNPTFDLVPSLTQHQLAPAARSLMQRSACRQCSRSRVLILLESKLHFRCGSQSLGLSEVHLSGHLKPLLCAKLKSLIRGNRSKHKRRGQTGFAEVQQMLRRIFLYNQKQTFDNAEDILGLIVRFFSSGGAG